MCGKSLREIRRLVLARRISRVAAGVSGLWWITPQEYTRSNVLSPYGNASASPTPKIGFQRLHGEALPGDVDGARR